jgi:hypothetical protein
MLQPERSAPVVPYPYAFNGKKMENVELFTTNNYDRMRSYDARVSGFYSVDLLTNKYCWNRPFTLRIEHQFEKTGVWI